jgi:hypothetical protein
MRNVTAVPSGTLAPPRPDHLVQFYEDESFLFDAAGAFLAAGAHAEQAIVIIATEAHREGLVGSLAARGEKIDHVETERRTRDGRRLTVSLTVSPIRGAAGEVLGASTWP